MISDIFLITGFGLISPILAIFIKDNIVGGTIFTAGLASTTHIVLKSLIQLPFSRYVDSHDDKVKWLLFGTCLMAIVPFIYMHATHIIHIFIAQVIFGISSGLSFPTWLGLWSTNLDKKHESFEWSLYSTLTGLGTASTAAIGAAIAQYYSFSITFLGAGAMAIVGSLILFTLEQKKEKLEKVAAINYHKKRKLVHNNKHSLLNF